LTRGIRLEPKIDVQYTVRDLTLDTAPIMEHAMGKAFKDVKRTLQLADPTVAVEAAIELKEKEPSLDDMKRLMIGRAMEATGGNKIAAAKLLGISPRMVYRWIGKMGEEAIT